MRLLGVLMSAYLDRDAPRWAAAALDSAATAAVARVLLTLPYWWSGVTKLVDWQGALAEAAGLGFAMPAAVVAATVAVQLAGSLLVIANRSAWLGAAALAAFTLLATMVAHPFWHFDGALRAVQQNTFLEHVALAAAFVLVAITSITRCARRRPKE